MKATAFAVDRASKLRRLVDADLRGIATNDETDTLHERDNLVAWMRILASMEKATENHIAKARKSIAHLKPLPGQPVSAEYLRAKAEVNRRDTGRLHFLEKVRGRRAEVAERISDAGLTQHTLGTVIDALVEVETVLAEGEIAGAHALLTALIDRYERDEEAS